MKAHRSLIVSALLAFLVVPSSCRSVRPPPPDEQPGTGGVLAVGGTGGRATGGTTGVAGSGGMTSPPDTNVPAPDVAVVDTRPPIEAMETCGTTGQPCCAGNLCVGGGCCEMGLCTPFGNSCRLAPSHSCLNNRCGIECGGVNMKCCAQRNCTAPQTACEGAATAVGTCVSCGGPGQPCCSGSYCAGGVMCAGGRCGSGPGDAGTDGPRDAPRG